MIVPKSIELDVGPVGFVRPPVGRDDIVGHQRLPGVAGDAHGEGPLQRAAGVHPPDGSPGAAHRLPGPRGAAVPGLHQLHADHGAVDVGVLHEHREVVGVGATLDVEGDLHAREVASHPPELHVDDAGVAELVVEAVLGHGPERRATEVEVVPGHGVVVHVGDDHPPRLAGAGRVVGGDTSDLDETRTGQRCILCMHVVGLDLTN